MFCHHMKQKRIDHHHRSLKKNSARCIKQETFNDMLMDVKYLDLTVVMRDEN